MEILEGQARTLLAKTFLASQIRIVFSESHLQLPETMKTALINVILEITYILRHIYLSLWQKHSLS